ncbi:restriction endonuclease subunit S [Acinetobacter johnsonii]|nr:restriction endonuclease subunit S [Acinetobacter johnsonii]MDH1487705.1 restriction endonuclease subunit S [Acinetobacter johnsonii]MDH1613636.1 restriction endonuclease subunit S [Acinetobacter johnsonii]
MAVPKLRFKEFSEDYNFSKFQEASIQIIDGDRGNNYPKSDDFYDNEYCLFLNAGNVTKSGFKFESTQFINKEKDALLRKGKLQKNDLVITTRGTVGNIAYFDESIPFENIRINSGMVIVRSEIDLEPIYLNQFLKSDLFEKWLEKNVFGSAQPQLTVKLLNSISISYPSKEEQTKIASFLSAVDEKISQLTEKHALLSQYKQGMMQKLFSQQLRFKADDGSEFGEWETTTLGQTGKFIGGGTPSKENSEFWEGSIPWISSSDLTEESIFKINITRFISQNALNQSATKLVPANSILIVSRVGVGKVAITPNEICTSQDFTSLTLHKGSSIFFAYLIKSLTPYLLEMNQGTSIKGFIKDDLANLELKIPCIEEQTKIANFLSAIDQKIEVVAQQIEQAKTWKKGLLQQMFV